MFRTLNLRGKKRSHFFQAFTGSKNGKISLSTQQIQFIEQSGALTLGEKIELLLVALGNKLTTELYMKIDYHWNNQEQKEMPDKTQAKQIEKLLKQLPFVYFQDSLPQKNRQNNHQQHFVWFQVSVNQAVNEFMKSYPDDLTEFEEGVLYGFPLSAIRAYSGLIAAKYDQLTPASSYLAGVCSADFWEDEQSYYELWWERLRKLSPAIVNEAEEIFFSEKNSK